MQRPEQHEIDTEAQRIFRSLLPSSWVDREQYPDYGIDYDIEIFENGQPTGISFYAQLKGTASPKYSGDALKLQFEVDKLKYYFEKVRKPVFLIAADVTSKKCFWLFTQKYIQQSLNKSKPDWYGQKTVTLYLPLSNLLPDTIQQLRTAAKDGFQYIYMLQLGRPDLRSSLEVQDKLNDPEAVKSAIRQNELETGELKLHIAKLHLVHDEREVAISELSKIMDETKEHGPAEIHIASAVNLAHARDFMDRAINRESAHTIELALKRQHQCKYRSVILLAKAMKSFLDLLYSFQQIRGYNVLIEIASSQNRGTGALLKVLQSEVFSTYIAAFDAMQSLISDAIQSNELNAAAQIMVQLSEAYLVIYPFVRLSSGEEQAKPILESASRTIETALNLANSLRNPELVCYALQSKSNLLFQSGGEDYEDALSQISDIAKASGLSHFDKAANGLRQTYKESKTLREKPAAAELQTELTLEQEVETVKSLAKLTGLDLDNENDSVAQMINLGIRDLNPERVLKFCQHLHVAITSYGLPGELFGLPTAGSKLLYCDMKDVAIGGMQLDDISAIFQSSYCNGCANREPHPDTWHCTRQWLRERARNMPAGLIKTLQNLRGH